MNQSLSFFSGEDIGRLGYPSEVFDAMRWAFLAVSSGAAEIPARQYVPLHQSQGNGLVMPAYARASPDGRYPDVYAVKMFNDIPGNRDAGRATFQGLTVLFDIATGLPMATFDAAALTALRTGVSTALATDILARPGGSVVGLVGAGPQGLSTLKALSMLRTISSVRVLTRHIAAVSELGFPVVACSDVREVAEGADMVVMATNSGSSLLALEMVGEACHVSALGSYRPSMRELGADLVAASRVWVDNLACMETSGDIIGSGVQPQLFGECLSLNEKPDGRTLYKSIGSAAQDVLAAWFCYKMLSN